MTHDKSVVKMTKLQKSRAADVLAGAFQDDPFYRFVIPDENRRERNLRWLMGKVIDYSILYGEAYTTPGVEGVICWLPPGATELKMGRIIRVGLHAIIARFGFAGYRRFNDNMTYSGKVHKSSIKESHWYLWAIGVDPACQGKGIGGELLRTVLARAGRTGTPCYLETHNQRNIPFYEKYGFRVVKEGRVPEHNLRIWGMATSTDDL